MTHLHSIHFSLEKVTDGIYAAIAKDGGGAVGNAGFIDLGDKTIVFDTFNTQQAAEDLKKMAEEITNRPVCWVVNSHWHGDHIRGNQAFKDCNIISSMTTYEKMKEIHPLRIKKQQDDSAGLHQYIRSLQEKRTEKNDEKLENQISFLKELARSLPTLELVLPQYTFENEFTIYGSKRTAILMKLGGGHSHCDSVLYIPEEEMMFMGDLLFVDTHPTFFTESNPIQWITILNRVKAMNIKTAIPGHGPTGTKEDIVKVTNYLNDLIAFSKENRGIEDIAMPIKYENWSSPESFRQNLKLLKDLV